jgi:hypothetical protein
MRLHGYIAVFFLPMAILYAGTGALYIIGESGAAPQASFNIKLPNGWPASSDGARKLASEWLQEHDLPALSTSAGQGTNGDDGYYWRALTHAILLTRISDSEAELIVQSNSLYRQLVEIHKDHAGLMFTIIGFAFGMGMLILILSGALMMFRSKQFRNSAAVLLTSGTAACLLAYVVSVFFL